MRVVKGGGILDVLKQDLISSAPNDRALGGTPYYVSQTAAWTLYAVVQYLLSRAPFALRVATTITWCATGVLGTELLRAYVRRRRFGTIPQLVRPFAVGVLVIPAVMNAACIALGVGFFHDRAELTQSWLIAAHYLQAVLLISVWCAVALAANEVHRRKAAEVEALQLALVAQTSQFRALRSQLNPHFLFNCLNGLRELIDEDPARAKTVIDLLSALLRYTLRADRVDTVSLKEELSAVEDYLSLEKIRFEERLRTHFDIDPRSLDSKLPPMLLQTLAENGVKHGIARLPAGGEVQLATRMLDDELRIQVINTGILSAAPEGSLALGLENARQRLRLMYGDGASLTLAAIDGWRVCAELVIPLGAARLAS